MARERTCCCRLIEGRLRVCAECPVHNSVVLGGNHTCEIVEATFVPTLAGPMPAWIRQGGRNG